MKRLVVMIAGLAALVVTGCSSALEVAGMQAQHINRPVEAQMLYRAADSARYIENQPAPTPEAQLGRDLATIALWGLLGGGR